MASNSTYPLPAPLRQATPVDSSTGPISNSRVPSPSEKGQPRPRAVVPTRDIVTKIVPVAVLLVLVIWANLSNLLGAFYKQGNHTKRAHVPLTSIVGGSRVDFHPPAVRSRLRPPSRASPGESTSTGADNGWKSTQNVVERRRKWYGWKAGKFIF